MAEEPPIETSTPPTRFDDTQVETIMGRLLQVGVVLAATVVLVGGILFLVRHGGEKVDLSQFHAEPERFRNPQEMVEAAADFSARGIIQLGLLMLVATPIARVVFSVYAFARQQDGMYVVFTLVVLAVLLFSLIYGDV